MPPIAYMIFFLLLFLYLVSFAALLVVLLQCREILAVLCKLVKRIGDSGCLAQPTKDRESDP